MVNYGATYSMDGVIDIHRPKTLQGLERSFYLGQTVSECKDFHCSYIDPRGNNLFAPSCILTLGRFQKSTSDRWRDEPPRFYRRPFVVFLSASNFYNQSVKMGS